jgi:hypothetical protein
VSECLKAAIITAIGSAISLGAALFCTYLTYNLALATLNKQKQDGDKNNVIKER